MIINKYLPVPRQTDSELWTRDKIEHVRSLSLTGRPYSIFERGGNRVIDKVEFRLTKNPEMSDSPTSSLSFSFSGIDMSMPLYLGDMSYGALSGNPNITIARVADMTGTLAGTGEGGLHPEVEKHHRIFVQWASARFGVDSRVLRAGLGVVIKIGQGAKPGIGGHLPGKKVTKPISLTRRIPEGMDAISPAPHHDIYSIEDLGQRIQALKEMTRKPVFVKVAATNYIPYVVAGIARMGADGVIIDGHGAGTGATPQVIRDNVGIPIELAVSSADNVLRKEGLRDKFTMIAAGRVTSATDAAKLIALGADVVSVGTGALIAMGCVMVHKCHIGSCPTALTNKIDGTREMDVEFGVKTLTNFINGFALEMRNILDNLGLRNIRELKGRRDLLYGNGLNEETLEILGIEGRIEELPPKQGELWTRRIEVYLHELMNKGEPVITSMGSTAPPDVETPGRITDWLRSDGAQVTRPPIDPYREDIDTSFYLDHGRVYLSLPVIFDVSAAPEKYSKAFTWASLALSSGIFSERTPENYEEIAFTADGKGIATWSRNPKEGVYLVIPSSLDVVEGLVGLDVPGFIIDEDEGKDDLELVVSKLDTTLKANGVRYYYDVIAKSSRIRDSADVFKMVLLGADATVVSYSLLERAIGQGSEGDLNERAFNMISGMKKEIALLAGAAGVYSVQSSLTGNRELLRSINLNKGVREMLRVKPAGGL